MISGPLSPRHGASSGCGWRIAANILNKQSRKANKGSPLDWGLDERITVPHRKTVTKWSREPRT